MPIKQAGKKALRQTKKHYAWNLARKEAMKSAIKKIKKAVPKHIPKKDFDRKSGMTRNVKKETKPKDTAEK